MGTYLKIGDTDVSAFITENKYSVTTVPVYDEESEYINIYGERVRARTGCEVTIDAVLCDVDDASAAALAKALSAKTVTAAYSAPELKSGSFEALKTALSLDRVYKGQKFWTAEIRLRASFVPDDGL